MNTAKDTGIVAWQRGEDGLRSVVSTEELTIGSSLELMKTDFCIFAYFILNTYHGWVRFVYYMFCLYVFRSFKKKHKKNGSKSNVLVKGIKHVVNSAPCSCYAFKTRAMFSKRFA